MAAALVATHVVFAIGFAWRYDLGPPARFLADAVRDGRPLATAPDYEGEYNFLARLERPIAIVDGRDAVPWAKAHPNGLLLVTLDKRSGALPWRPRATFPHRDKTLTIWDAATVIESEGKVMGDRF
jgi:hypothetical protein